MFQEVTITILLILSVIVLRHHSLYCYCCILRIRIRDNITVLRNFPLLGRVRYVFEMIGPELRQYMFDGDNQGKRTI